MQGASLPRSDVQRWLEHPDERVTSALVRAHNISLSESELSELSTRAMASARRERVIWTPLLDALQTRLWEDGRHHETLRLTWHPAFHHYDRRLKRIKKWIGEANWQQTLPLFGFDSLEVHRAVIENARALPVEWVTYSCERKPLGVLRFAISDRLTHAAAKGLLAFLLMQGQALLSGAGQERILDYLQALIRFAKSSPLTVAECARAEAIMSTLPESPDIRSEMIEWAQQHIVDSLENYAPNSQHVRSADVAQLLASKNDAVRLATLPLISELEHLAV